MLKLVCFWIFGCLFCGGLEGVRGDRSMVNNRMRFVLMCVFV